MKDLGDLHFFFGMEVERDCAQRLLYINHQHLQGTLQFKL
jgi:hypothetical protein